MFLWPYFRVYRVWQVGCNQVWLDWGRPHDPIHCNKQPRFSIQPPIGEGRTQMASKITTVEFIERCRAVHGISPDYSQTKYVDAKTPLQVICTKHGGYWQTPLNHLRGNGCPLCGKEARWANTFKQKCKDLDIDYWRALKRREAGMSDEKVFDDEYVRGEKETSSAMTAYGVSYPNIESACRALLPTANPTTIGRWIRGGMSPEEAFERIPNPGYAAGAIYLVTHVASGKKYVGLTIQGLERRWTYHLEQARAGHIKGADSLHAAIREYGSEAFTRVQIDSGKAKIDLEKKERYWIQFHGTLTPNGYNISTGGVSGGSNRKPITLDGERFPSVGAACEHIAQALGISIHAAKARIRFDRVHIKTPAKKGESLVKTSAYKAWSQIVHGVANPKSKAYIIGANVHEPWRIFETFLADVGQPPEAGMVFTRINKSKWYFPDNCSWLSKSESSKLTVAHRKSLGTVSGRRRHSARASNGL